MVEAHNSSSFEFDEDAEKEKQRSREQNAFRSVLQNRPISPQHSLQSIHEYTQKTKALLTDDYSKTPHGFTCSMTYRSALRTITVNEQHANKRGVKHSCVLSLLKRNFSLSQPLATFLNCRRHI